MGSVSALSTHELACGYRGRTVLSGANLEFWLGTCTAILGPNGSGKSTLLKTLSGELSPVSGEVRVGGGLLAGLTVREIASRVAVVPQQETIPFRFSVWEVAMMGRIAKSDSLWDTEEDRLAVEQALEFTDSLQFRDRPINELSGGERQRVLLARAIAQEADVLLLDEPTTHLDIPHQLSVCKLVKRLRESGKTIVAAMHDLNLIGEMAERAILLDRGSVANSGTSEEVLRSSALNEAYGIEFRRITDGGSTLVLPPSS